MIFHPGPAATLHTAAMTAFNRAFDEVWDEVWDRLYGPAFDEVWDRLYGGKADEPEPEGGEPKGGEGGEGGEPEGGEGGEPEGGEGGEGGEPEGGEGGEPLAERCTQLCCTLERRMPGRPSAVVKENPSDADFDACPATLRTKPCVLGGAFVVFAVLVARLLSQN